MRSNPLLLCRVVVAVLASCWLLQTPAAVRAEERPDKLVIGFQKIPNAEIVAKDLKWQEAELGIPVEWVEFDSGMHVSNALAAGRVDIGLVGSSPCALGIAKGVPMEVIWIHDLIGDNEALVARDQAGISTVADLKGKTVAAPFGSTTHYHLMVALRLNHIDVAEVHLKNLEPRDLPTAWDKGEIDAAFVWMPVLAKLTEHGGHIIVTSRQLVMQGFPTGDLCVVRSDFAERYPAIVLKYLKVLNQAVVFTRAHPQAAAEAVARQFGISVEEAQREMQGLILLSAEEQDSGKYFGGEHWNFGLYTVLKETADFLEEEGLVETLPPRSAFMDAVNASFLVRLLDQLTQPQEAND